LKSTVPNSNRVTYISANYKNCDVFN